MYSNHDEDVSARRRLGELLSQLERHDRVYHCRHTRESTLLRTELVRQIQALRADVGAYETSETNSIRLHWRQ